MSPRTPPGSPFSGPLARDQFDVVYTDAAGTRSARSEHRIQHLLPRGGIGRLLCPLRDLSESRSGYAHYPASELVSKAQAGWRKDGISNGALQLVRDGRRALAIHCRRFRPRHGGVGFDPRWAHAAEEQLNGSAVRWKVDTLRGVNDRPPLRISYMQERAHTVICRLLIGSPFHAFCVHVIARPHSGRLRVLGARTRRADHSQGGSRQASEGA